MKNTFNLHPILIACLLALFCSTFNACTEEQVIPTSINQDSQISSRTDGPVSAAKVMQKVSVRDNIPLSQILTCYYFGQTSQGYYEYHLTTMYNGPKIYIVMSIIGDEFEGA